MASSLRIGSASILTEESRSKDYNKPHSLIERAPIETESKGRKIMERKEFDSLAGLRGDVVVEISGELRKLLPDVFALYVKTKISTGT
jgi:hypothetical protein